MTTRQVKLISKKEFTASALDLEHRISEVYEAGLSIDLGDEVHPLRKAQIAHLKADKAATKVPSKYANFADIFSSKRVAELPEYTKINDYAIKLVDDQQPPYGLFIT